MCFNAAIEQASADLSLDPTDQFGSNLNRDGNLLSGLLLEAGGNFLLLDIVQFNGSGDFRTENPGQLISERPLIVFDLA